MSNSVRPIGDGNADVAIQAVPEAPTVPELNAILPGPEETEAPVVDAPPHPAVLLKRLRLIGAQLNAFNLRPDFGDEARAILAGDRDEAEEP